MSRSAGVRRSFFLAAGVALLLGQAGSAHAQLGNLGQPGGPGLLGGLQLGGAAVKQGIGPIVSNAAHQGIHGRQLAALIHQLKAARGKGHNKGQGQLGQLNAAGIGGLPLALGGLVPNLGQLPNLGQMPGGLGPQGHGKGKGKGKGKGGQ